MGESAATEDSTDLVDTVPIVDFGRWVFAVVEAVVRVEEEVIVAVGVVGTEVEDYR